MPIDLPPRCARDYEPLALLAQGGFGMVVRARQRSLDRIVALKLLLECHLTDETVRGRFVQEARVTAALVHPNIVPLIDHDVEAGVPWIVYEFVSGKSLEARAHEGGLDLGAVLEAALAVSRALAVAHAQGIIHRDIKPANVLGGEDGIFKVTDFGIARWEPGLKTGTGLLLGTPAYLAPEYIGQGTLAPSSDLYALGVMLFELATGTLPFHDPSPMKLLEMQLTAPVPDPRSRWPAIPAALAELIRNLLAKDPLHRPASATEATRRLLELRESLTASGNTPVRTPPSRVPAVGPRNASPTASVTSIPGRGEATSAVELASTSRIDAPRPISRRLWRHGLVGLAIASLAAATLFAFGVSRPGPPVLVITSPEPGAPRQLRIQVEGEGKEPWDISVESVPAGFNWTTRALPGVPGVVEGVRAGRLHRVSALQGEQRLEQEITTPPYVAIRDLTVLGGIRSVLVDFDHTSASEVLVRLVPGDGGTPLEKQAEGPARRWFRESFRDVLPDIDYRVEIQVPGRWVSPVRKSVRLRREDPQARLVAARRHFESRRPGSVQGENLLDPATLEALPGSIGPDESHHLEVILANASLDDIQGKATHLLARPLREPALARILHARLREAKPLHARHVPMLLTAAHCRPDPEIAHDLLRMTRELLGRPTSELNEAPPETWLPGLALDLDLSAAWEILLEESQVRARPDQVTAAMLHAGHGARFEQLPDARPKGVGEMIFALRDAPADWDQLVVTSRTSSRRVRRGLVGPGKDLRDRVLTEGLEPRSPAAREAVKALALTSNPAAAKLVLAEWDAFPRPASLWSVVMAGERPALTPLASILDLPERRAGLHSQVLMAMGMLEHEGLDAKYLPPPGAEKSDRGRAAIWAIGWRAPDRLPDSLIAASGPQSDEVLLWTLGRSRDARAPERLTSILEALQRTCAEPGADRHLFSRLAMTAWALDARDSLPGDWVAGLSAMGPAWFRALIARIADRTARDRPGIVTFIMFPWIPVFDTGLTLEPGDELQVRALGHFGGAEEGRPLHEGIFVTRRIGDPEGPGAKGLTGSVHLRPRLIAGAQGMRLDHDPVRGPMRFRYDPVTDRSGRVLLSPLEEFELNLAELHPLPQGWGFALVDLEVVR